MNIDSARDSPFRTPAALDGSAITLSTLCIAHCLVVPLLTAMLPLSASWLDNEWLHRVLVLTALPITLCAVYSSVRYERGVAFPVIALMAITLLVAAAFAEPLHDFETSLTVIAALALAGAHAFRWMLRHQHQDV